MPLELPPIVTTAKYVAVYDQYGVLQVIALPSAPGVLVFDGTNLLWASGATGNQINLSGVPDIAGAAISNGFLLADGSGKLAKLGSGSGTDNTFRVLSFKNKVPTLQTLAALLGTGHGLLRQKLDGSIDWLGGATGVQGLYLANEDGTVSLVNTHGATAGTLLTMTPDGLAFAQPSGVSQTAAANESGLADIFALRPTTTTITVKCPMMVVANAGGDKIQINGLDATLDISTTGANGIDIAGGATAATWYYLYAIAKEDGTLGVVASASPSGPNLTLSVDYVYFGLASIFYVKSDGTIRPYIQQGRVFSQDDTLWVANWVTPATLTVVPGDVALSTLVPNNFVKTVSGRIGGGSGETASRRYLVAATSSETLGSFYIANEPAGTQNNFRFNSGYFRNIPITTPGVPVLYAKVLTGGSGVRTRMSVTGFTI